jgi:membrane-associated protease RseP (regulator of RpoE activity)
MRFRKLSPILVIGGLLVSGAIATVAFGQPRPQPQPRIDGLLLSGRSATIGVSVRDLTPPEAGRQKVDGGVLIESVRAGSPAERAGIRTADVVVEFDGEHVRSARQFSRLVQETAEGRDVKTTIVRDGRKTEVSITPAAGSASDALIDRDDLRERLRDFAIRIPFDFDLDRDLPTLERFSQLYSEAISAVADVISAFGGREEFERGGDQCGDVIERAWPRRPQKRLEFREGLFNWIEVGTVGRQKSEVRADRFDRRADLGLFVHREIIEDDDVAGSEGQYQHLFDIG